MQKKKRKNSLTANIKDLYKPENIVKYSRKVNNEKSIHFKNGDLHGIVKQVKNIKANIKKNIEMISVEYRMINANEGETKKLVKN